MRDAGDGAGDDQADAGTARPSSASTRSRWPTTPATCSTRASTPSSGIAHGTYGICESCGNPIGKLRLQAVPSCDPVHVMQAEAGAPLIPAPAPDASPTPSSAVPVNPDPRPPCDRDAALFAVLVAAAVTVYTADQLTKAWAAATLPPEQPRHLIGSLLQLNLIRNPGAAFSIGTGYTWVLTLVACMRRRGDRGHQPAPRQPRAGPGRSVCCSAARSATSPTGSSARPGLGRGHVVDFLSYRTGPIGNVADIGIVGDRGRADRAARPARHRRRRDAGRGARAQARHQRGTSAMPDVRSLPVPDGLEGERVDAALARLFGLSRTKAADLAAAGAVTLDQRDGRQVRPRRGRRVAGGGAARAAATGAASWSPSRCPACGRPRRRRLRRRRQAGRRRRPPERRVDRPHGHRRPGRGRLPHLHLAGPPSARASCTASTSARAG